MTRSLVIGCGNPLRGDDGAGREVAWRLAEGSGGTFDVAESSGDAADLIAKFAGRDKVLLVDACQTGAAPGSLFRFDVSSRKLPAELSNLSSHGFGVGEAVELARALGQLPATVIVHAIEGDEFELGQGLSPAVRAALDRLEVAVMADAA